MSERVRTDWTRLEISHLYHQPLLDLVSQARTVHRDFHPAKPNPAPDEDAEMLHELGLKPMQV